MKEFDAALCICLFAVHHSDETSDSQGGGSLNEFHVAEDFSVVSFRYVDLGNRNRVLIIDGSRRDIESWKLKQQLPG